MVQPRESRVAEGQEQFEQWRISGQSNDIVLSQEDAHQTYCTTRQIARETGIYRSSVVRIIRDELHLKCVKKRHAQELTEANCITRLSRTKKLLSKFPESAVDFIFFTDQKVFPSSTTVFLRRVGRRCATFPPTVCFALGRRSASVSWCLSGSQFGCTELIFVAPGVKVDGAYYRDVLLSN